MFLGPLPPATASMLLDKIFLKNNLLILYNAFT